MRSALDHATCPGRDSRYHDPPQQCPSTEDPWLGSPSRCPSSVTTWRPEVVAEWLKKVGDKVNRGEAIAEIETEKATVEMEATASGTLVEQTLAPGEEVPVGTVIGYLESDD